MSQMQAIDTIQQEIAEINKAQKDSLETKKILRELILSDKFLSEYRDFDLKLSIWADSLLTLVEATGTSFQGEGKNGVPSLMQYNQFPAGVGFPQGIMQGAENMGSTAITKVEQADLTLSKALVLVVANITVFGVIVVVHAPWIVSPLFAVASVTLAFFKQIAETIRDFTEKPEEEKLDLGDLRNKISESLSYMRKEYVKRRFLIKQQNVEAEMITNLDPQDDEALYNRKAQTGEKMPSDFMSRIDDISVECNNAAFRRKMVLYRYLKDQPSMPVHTPQ